MKNNRVILPYRLMIKAASKMLSFDRKPMHCHSHLGNYTVDQLMDQLYPRVFSTFVNSNPALDQRADFYRTFFRDHNFYSLLDDEKGEPFQVLEVGSGTGIGSANNARILAEIVNGIRYVAVDKRKQLVDMTEGRLLSALSGTKSSAAVFVHDGLHNITNGDLQYFGFQQGGVDFYFAEHSTYSELYDFRKTTAYLNGLKEILKECALAFIVVQTEHAEIQKLVGRNVKSAIDHALHILNIDKALEVLKFHVLAKFLNPTKLTFPKLSHAEWDSIRTRTSDLSCFASSAVEKTVELMTFVKKPLNCLNDTELSGYVDLLQQCLKQKNNMVSNDEYIYVISSTDCSNKKPDNDSKQISSGVAEAVIHGFLRGASHCVNQKLHTRGMSKSSSYLWGQFTYYSGFFATKFVSHYHAEIDGVSCLNSLYSAAIETGQLMFVNAALGLMDQALAYSEKLLDQRQKGSWFSKGINVCRLLAPFSVFANNAGNIASAATAMAVGGVVETVTRKKFG